jgi:curved DNA-binding protein CbpA
MIKIDYYEILELPSDADERMIKKAYYRLARELHPDKASNPDEAKNYEERFAQVSAAYNILKDPQKREEYRNHNAQKNPGAAQTVPTSTARVINASRGVPAGKSADTNAKSSRQDLGLTPEKIAIAQKAYTRGMQHCKENQYNKAIEYFEAAIQNNDTEPAYHARLGLALIQARKSAARAVDLAQKAIELDPYNINHKLNLAFIFETIGSTSNARRLYEDILRWDAENHQAIAALERLSGGKWRFGLGSSSRHAQSGAPASSSGGGLINSLFGKFRK